MGKMTGCLHRKQDFWMRSLILSRAACKKVRRKTEGVDPEKKATQDKLIILNRE